MEIDSLHERALDDRTEEHKLANNQHIHQVKHWQSNQPPLKPHSTELTVITQAVSTSGPCACWPSVETVIHIPREGHNQLCAC